MKTTSPPSVILYHYTSGDGLLGIINSDSLWATKIHFMNDHQEFKHACGLAIPHLYGLRAGHGGDTFAQIAVALAEVIESVERLSLFVTCFSEDHDSLSQWRGYCPRSFGYNLGFDGDLLLSIARDQGFQLRPCIYDAKEQEQQIREWGIEFVTRLAGNAPARVDPKEYTRQNCNDAMTKFISFAPYMKDSAFKHEREWRLVGLIPGEDSRLGLRAGRSTLVPYVPIQLHSRTVDSPLWEIRVGPTPQKELAMDAMGVLFQKAKIRNGITHTAIPYRDW